jgi:hypothetical protein
MPLDKRLLEELAKAKAFVESDEEKRYSNLVYFLIILIKQSPTKRVNPAPSLGGGIGATSHAKKWRRSLLPPRKPAHQGN